MSKMAVLAVSGVVGLLIAGISGCEKRQRTGPPAVPPAVEAAAVTTAPAAAGEQTVCPISGEKIDKKVSTTYQGKKVYFCCEGCIKPFLKDPKKYTAKLPQFGGKETPGQGEGMPGMDGS